MNRSLAAAFGAVRVCLRVCVNRRTPSIAVVFGIALSCSGDESPGSLQTVHHVAPWVKTDLRVLNLKQARLAAAKYATRCSRLHPAQLGVYVSGVVLTAAGTALLPDHIASQLACAYDAPAGTSCEALDECAEAGHGEAHMMPECRGSVLRGREPQTGKGVLVACRAFGGTCYGFEGGALCATGPCSAGELSVCNGDSISICTMGVRMASPCGRGMTCKENAEGIVDCVGKGPDCANAPRCDGALAVNCAANNFGSKREQVFDCGSFGMKCALKEQFDGTPVATCEPRAVECDPLKNQASCAADKLRICAAGTWWAVSCGELALTGRCTEGLGARGEAGCQ